MKDKVLKGFTIKVSQQSVKFIPEDETYPWWREQLNRKKDGLICPQILKDMLKIGMNLSRENERGERVGKYNLFLTNLSPNPKSSQGKSKREYKEALISKLKKRSAELEKFKDKKILLYVAIYLRKERFESNDVDNFLKAIIDAIKEYTGDDSSVVSVLAVKKLLENYPEEDLDFLEQIFIAITDPQAGSDILRE